VYFTRWWGFYLDICVIKCKKADNLIFCQKKGGVENAYIRTGPETIILPPSKLEAYIKNKFLKVKK